MHSDLNAQLNNLIKLWENKANHPSYIMNKKNPKFEFKLDIKITIKIINLY